MNIEIVSHCWKYWRCLTYQVSHLFHHSSGLEHQVELSVLVSPEDHQTCQRLLELSLLSWPDNVRINVLELPKERLMCRGVGRNLRALNTKADVVWFTDCDYLIGKHCLNRIAELFSEEKDRFLFPRQIQGTTHQQGLELIQAVEHWEGPPLLDEKLFSETMKYNRAIGGVQIVSGSLCRQFGYLKDCPAWNKPARSWKKTVEDVWFRKDLQHNGYAAERVNIPGIHRIRHAMAGRHDPMVEL